MLFEGSFLFVLKAVRDPTSANAGLEAHRQPVGVRNNAIYSVIEPGGSVGKPGYVVYRVSVGWSR